MTCKEHGPDCRRLHIGDVVKVTYGPQLGYGQTGTIVGESGADHFTVRFPGGVDSGIEGVQPFTELSYAEGELTKVDPISEYYRRKDAEFAAERQAHLDAGKPMSTFVPKTIID